MVRTRPSVRGGVLNLFGLKGKQSLIFTSATLVNARAQIQDTSPGTSIEGKRAGGLLCELPRIFSKPSD